MLTLFIQIAFASESFSWGEPSRIDISQEKIDVIIKQYVDTNMADKVKSYNHFLQMQKETKLAKYADKTFVQNTLMWQDMKLNQNKKMDIAYLKVYCRDLVLADRKDWRVPTYYELLELVDYSHVPSYVKGLKYVADDNYWSISKDITKKDHYWIVDFKKGVTDTKNELENYSIRCVRTLSTKRGEY
jgi:hypothetical protein